MTDIMEAVGVGAEKGKCFDQAMKEVKLPKSEQWGGPTSSSCSATSTALLLLAHRVAVSSTAVCSTRLRRAGPMEDR